MSWQGIRAEESVVRADMKMRQHLSGKHGTYHAFRPLLHWKLDDVLAMHKKHGIKANPLYAEGFSRVGCFPCIFVQKKEIALLARNYPEQIDRIEKWEQLMNETGRVERSTSFFFAGKDPTYRKGQKAGIRRIADWAQTKRGGKQYELVPTISKAQEHMAESCAESGV